MFNGTLYEAQKPGAEFLVNKRKVLFAWEQGCGKTIISLAAASKLFDLGKSKTCLIVSPSGLTWQWADKIEEFTNSEYVLAEADSRNSRSYEPIENGYNVVGYHLFRNDFRTILNNRYDIVICDEAQEFRSTKSKTRKLVLELNRAMDPMYRWALTGTAIANHLEELYSIFYWVDKTFLPPWPIFEKQHIVRNHNNQIYKYKNVKSLNKHLVKRLNRKEMHEMGVDYPKLVERIVTIKRSKEYEAAEKDLLAQLDSLADALAKNPRASKGKTAKVFSKVKKYLWSYSKLIQVSSHAKTVIKENEENRILIFSFRKQPLYELQQKLSSLNISSLLYTGKESSSDKKVIARRIEAAETRVLLASNAGYKGLDLPSVNNIAHVDIPPSWEILDQRNKRGRRLTSKHSTTVVTYFPYEYSLELYYLSQVIRKGKLADATYHGTVDEVVVKPESLRQFLRKSDEQRGRLLSRSIKS